MNSCLVFFCSKVVSILYIFRKYTKKLFNPSPFERLIWDIQKIALDFLSENSIQLSDTNSESNIHKFKNMKAMP